MKKIFDTLIVVVVLFFTTNLNAQNHEIWGVTGYGGTNKGGVLFNTDENGNNFNVKNNFSIENVGTYPQGRMAEAPNGNLYGTTYSGGDYDDGVLFEYNPNANTYSVLYNFEEVTSGKDPNDVIYFNGKLYGTTSHGGQYDLGTFYEFDINTNIYKRLFTFTNSTSTYPRGGLLLADNNKIYGVTLFGGNYDDGQIYEYDPILDTLIIKDNFSEYTEGSRPYGYLIQAEDGFVYGLTTNGSQNNGRIFKYDISTGTLSKVFELGDIDARYGLSLVNGGDGKLYGTTLYNTSNVGGVLFNYDLSSGIVTKLYEFSEGTELGSRPGNISILSNGKIYGTTSNSGNYDGGNLYEYDILLDTITIVEYSNGYNESKPTGMFVEATNGGIYGFTSGIYDGEGAICEFNLIASSLVNNIYFNLSPNGRIPMGGLVQASNGKLYGVTKEGGVFNYGALYEYNLSNNTISTKLNFRGSNGMYPNGKIIINNDKIYGVTKYDSINWKGVIYEYDLATETMTILHNFVNSTEGETPIGELFLADNGKLYGTTNNGGATNNGTIYEYDLQTGVYTKLVDLESSIGRFPTDGLVQANNGKLYGLTQGGGASYRGVLYEYTPSSGAYTVKLDFSNMENPLGRLTLASDGALYACAYDGGSNNYYGGIFKYTPSTNEYIELFSFSGSDGSGPSSTLIEGANGKLYGLTSSGGDYDYGVLFEYDIINDTLIVKKHFNDTIGKNPTTQLLEISSCYPLESNSAVEACGNYTSPSGNQTFTSAGTYTVMDTVARDCGADSILYIDLTVLDLPQVTANANETSLCEGDDLTLFGSGEGTFTWDNGVTDNVSFVPTSTTLYTVTADDGSCTNTDTITVFVYPYPVQPTIVLYGGQLMSSSAENNQWYYTTIQLPGETGQFLTPASSGEYFVEVTENGCSTMSEGYNYSATSVETLEEDNFSIYPNPANNYVFIQSSKNKIESVEIIDITGKIVETINDIEKNSISINVSVYNKGVYFISVKTDNYNKMKKLIIE